MPVSSETGLGESLTTHPPGKPFMRPIVVSLLLSYLYHTNHPQRKSRCRVNTTYYITVSTEERINSSEFPPIFQKFLV